MSSTVTDYIRSFWLRIVLLVLTLLVVLLTPKKYSIDTWGSRLSGTGQVAQQVGDEQLSYTPYRPNETEGFAFMEKEFISDIYVPYDAILTDGSASPYEIRWPRYKLPNWARKAETSWRDVPKGKHICFVSVGKTAGSSLSGLLGFQLHGPDVYFIPSGLLPHYTTHFFHKTVNNCAEDTPYFLFSLRHPLERLLSAFAYDRDKYGSREKKTQYLYKHCGFQTLNILAVEGLAEDGRASEKCKKVAFDLVRGYGYIYSDHLFFNYHYYHNVSFATAEHRKDSKILVIRTEHMEDDWDKAERAVGGDKHVDLNVPHLNAHAKEPWDAILSEKSQVLLCDALCDEIQLYKRILREAINLNRKDYAQSMAELKESCPLQVSADSCSSSISRR